MGWFLVKSLGSFVTFLVKRAMQITFDWNKDSPSITYTLITFKDGQVTRNKTLEPTERKDEQRGLGDRLPFP